MPLPLIRFPVLCFNQGIVVLARGEDELTTCTSAALKNGWYDGLHVVDASGGSFRVRGAKFLRGVGRFGGYDIFLNRRIKVDLDIHADASALTADGLKTLVRRSFRDWHGWSSRGDFAELKERLERTRTLDEVIGFLREELDGAEGESRS